MSDTKKLEQSLRSFRAAWKSSVDIYNGTFTFIYVLLWNLFDWNSGTCIWHPLLYDQKDRTDLEESYEEELCYKRNQIFTAS